MAGIVVRTVAFAILLVGCRAWLRQPAQDRRAQHQPGQFDFYVLALSWSPSFCQDSEERGREAREQCGAAGPIRSWCTACGRNTSAAFRESCQLPAPRLNRDLMTSMLDLMPAPRLIYHEWDRHGTCSGLRRAGLFRPGPQGARQRENPGGLCDPEDHADGGAGRGRGGVRQSQSRAFARRHRGDLRQHAAERGPHLHVKDLKFRDCAEDRSPGLPARQAADAAGARRLRRADDRSLAPSRTTMEHYAGINVSFESASMCVVDASGQLVREYKLACEPDALSPASDRSALARDADPAGVFSVVSMALCVDAAIGAWRSYCWRRGMCVMHSRRCRC